jgi:O-methyltransferase involved in polyketide biosynthesis
VADFDPLIPSIARVYDYFLGGADNFAADRELGERLVGMVPAIPVTVRENRQFLGRAVTWAADQGVSQFIDLGAGMPTSPSTHESAQAVVPGACVAYVDNDPVVLTRLRALRAAGSTGVTVVDGDVRAADAVLGAVAEGIDLSEPACLIMGSLLHFFAPPAAAGLVARYARALAAGSYVILTTGMASGDAAEQFFRLYSAGPTKLYQHSPDDFAAFFGSLDLVPPGIGDARTLRPGHADVPAAPPRDAWMIVGIARTG